MVRPRLKIVELASISRVGLWCRRVFHIGNIRRLMKILAILAILISDIIVSNIVFNASKSDTNIYETYQLIFKILVKTIKSNSQ